MAAAGHADPRTINLVRYRRPMDDPAEVWRTVLNRRDSAEPAGAFHANLNLAKRRLCDALVGTSLGSAAHCRAISVARVRAALTASIPRSNRPLARRATFGAAKSCLLVIFMIRPPTARAPTGNSNNAHRFAALSWRAGYAGTSTGRVQLGGIASPPAAGD
jgi:hypothetical protein